MSKLVNVARSRSAPIGAARLASALPTAALLTLAPLAACAPQLMRTPNLYVASPIDPWAEVPEILRTAGVDVVYATDRVPTDQRGSPGDGHARYGHLRSQSLAFGLCRVELGDGLTWTELVEQSRRRHRSRSIPLRVGPIREHGRFPPTPWRVQLVDGRSRVDPRIVEQDALTRREFQTLVGQRLSLSPCKEVFVFVHGFNTSFDESACIMAELWHFLGRVGVPVVYAWPSGGGLNVQGYNYDRESGEFTVFHLKAFLEALATTPGLEHMHLLAHSRGADVLTTALRELNIKYQVLDAADDRAAARALRIGQLVLAAPDIDVEVAGQRLAAEGLTDVCEQMTVYTSPDDLALEIARWLFASTVRLGTLGLTDLPKDHRLDLAQIRGLSLIDTRVSGDLAGHSYFYQNPAVSSDLILLLRDGLAPGAEFGRPLSGSGAVWVLGDDYPRTAP